jgi:hypothetical protein
MGGDKYIGLDVYQSTLARLETNGFNKPASYTQFLT